MRQSHRALNATSTDFAKEEILSYQQTTVEWQTKCEALQQERDVMLAQTNELAFNKDLQVHQQGRNATLEKEVLKLRSSLAVHVEELKNVSQLLEVNGRYNERYTMLGSVLNVYSTCSFFLFSLLSSLHQRQRPYHTHRRPTGPHHTAAHQTQKRSPATGTAAPRGGVAIARPTQVKAVTMLYTFCSFHGMVQVVQACICICLCLCNA